MHEIKHLQSDTSKKANLQTNQPFESPSRQVVRWCLDRFCWVPKRVCGLCWLCVEQAPQPFHRCPGRRSFIWAVSKQYLFTIRPRKQISQELKSARLRQDLTCHSQQFRGPLLVDALAFGLSRFEELRVGGGSGIWYCST